MPIDGIHYFYPHRFQQLRTSIQFFFLLLFLSGAFSVHAQENSKLKGYSIGVRGHYGFLAPHYGSMRYLVQQHAWEGEIVVSKQTNGEKPWQRSHNYPLIEYSFMHLNPGSPDYIGNVEVLMARLNYVKGKSKLFKNCITMGAGLAYVSKPFDRLENHKNIAIGSYINLAVNFQYLARFTIHKNFDLDAGIEILHLSNTLMRSPNLGINLPLLSLGLHYKIPYEEADYNRDSVPTINKWNIFSVAGAFGIKETLVPGGKKYSAFSLWGDYMRVLNHKWAVGGGMDIFYDTTIKYTKDLAGESHNNTTDIARMGIHCGFEILISRLSLFQHAGIYLHNTRKRDKNIYNRSGMRYRFNNHIFGYIALKAHVTKADYSEFGVGYIF